MSDQGAVHHEPDFGLIETILWRRESGFFLLAEHLHRLATSSLLLGFDFDEPTVLRALQNAIQLDGNEQRIRLVLSVDGTCSTSAQVIRPLPNETVWKVVIARATFQSTNSLLRHKTTERAVYEDELRHAKAQFQADEVLFLNERDEICEGARCNFFAVIDGVMLTPHLDCGLLPGTLRASLLATGEAREAVLKLSDLDCSTELFMGNSVRGLVRCHLDR